MRDPNYIEILNQCYRYEADADAWLASVLDASAGLLELGRGYGFSMQRGSETGPVPLLNGYRGMPVDPFHYVAGVTRLDADAFRTLWYPRTPVTFLTPLLSELSPRYRGLIREYLRSAQVQDMIGLLGHPTSDVAFVIWAGVTQRQQVSTRVRDALHRARLHIEAALRLRLLGTERAVAVLTPAGKIEYLHPSAQQNAAPERFVEHTRSVERARSRRRRADAREALEIWRALVEGRWSLVERDDTDGRRLYYAFENPPQTLHYRGLSAVEAAVVDLSSKGLTGKYVAYALGITESTVSRSLQAAATRLGFRDRTTVLRFASRALRAGSVLAGVAGQLTQAERAVLDLVRQGLSNREIAAARATAPSTVANQLASLLRKTGSSSRKALLVSVGEPEI